MGRPSALLPMVALAAVLAAATDAVPGLTPSRVEADEAAAIASLREIAAAQAAFQASGVCDVDQDGVGEFGLLRELSGRMGVRTTPSASTVGSVVDPPLLPVAFRRSDGWSEVLRDGYRLLVVLPGWVGTGVPEISSGALASALDSDLAETTWCAYAWPDRYGATGRRTFCIDRTGAIVATDQASYSGEGAIQSANAGVAFATGNGLGATGVLGPLADGTIGWDGNFWRAVETHDADVEQIVRGRLTPVGRDGVGGTFEIASRRLTTRSIETIIVRRASGEPISRAHLALSDSAGTVSAAIDATACWLLPSGRLACGFDSEFRPFPDGVTTMTVFGGGTIEVRIDGAVAARGAIPEFVTADGPNVPGAYARWRGRSTLSPPFPGDPGGGTVTAEIENTPRITRQLVRVELDGLAGETSPWTFFSWNGNGQGLSVALAARGRRARVSRTIDSARRGRLADGTLVGLSGMRMIVSSPRWGTLLTGTFPGVE